MRTFFVLLTLIFSARSICKVKLCEHNHKPGKCCELQPGYYRDMRLLPSSCPGNDELSRVTSKGQCRVYLFEHRLYRGQRWNLFGHRTWRASIWNNGPFRNDAVSSLLIYDYLCVVKLCKHKDSWLNCCTIRRRGSYSYDVNHFSRVCAGNDQLSKVKITGRCSIILYTDYRFKGRSYVLRGPGEWKAGRRWLWKYSHKPFPDDRISSFIIL